MDTLVIWFPWWVQPITESQSLYMAEGIKKSTGLQKPSTLFSKKAVESYVRSEALLEMQVMSWLVLTLAVCHLCPTFSPSSEEKSGKKNQLGNIGK